MTQLQWVKNSTNGQWFDLLRLNLSTPYFTNKFGVYIIWYSAPTPAVSRVIRVGQGDIGIRLKEHSTNPEIIKYSQYGQLKVTWALVDTQFVDGVEAFLFDSYTPIIGERKPAAQPIPVNLI